MTCLQKREQGGEKEVPLAEARKGHTVQQSTKTNSRIESTARKTQKKLSAKARKVPGTQWAESAQPTNEAKGTKRICATSTTKSTGRQQSTIRGRVTHTHHKMEDDECLQKERLRVQIPTEQQMLTET